MIYDYKKLLNKPLAGPLTKKKINSMKYISQQIRDYSVEVSSTFLQQHIPQVLDNHSLLNIYGFKYFL